MNSSVKYVESNVKTLVYDLGVENSMNHILNCILGDLKRCYRSGLELDGYLSQTYGRSETVGQPLVFTLKKELFIAE